jgi:hypothetical protein
VRIQDLKARMLERLRDQVPADFIALYEEETASGEPQLALETLLDNLLEDEVPITRGLADDIKELAKYLQVTRKIEYLDEIVSN